MIETKKLIGRNKYNALKRFDFDSMDEIQMVQFRKEFGMSVAKAIEEIKYYEKSLPKGTKESMRKNAEYFEKLDQRILSDNKAKKNLTKNDLWNEFIRAYYRNEGINFIADDESIENLKPLFFYFLQDQEEFSKCENVISSISTPDVVNKNLLIIGDYGNGKTSTIKAIKNVFDKTDSPFLFVTSEEIVDSFESIQNEKDRKEFIERYQRGLICFDDVKAERTAKRYGTFNLMQEIIKKRYSKKLRTIITTNFKAVRDLTNGQIERLKKVQKDPDRYLNTRVEIALEEFKEKYGARVYDRMFSYNIVVFRGKSRR